MKNVDIAAFIPCGGGSEPHLGHRSSQKWGEC